MQGVGSSAASNFETCAVRGGCCNLKGRTVDLMWNETRKAKAKRGDYAHRGYCNLKGRSADLMWDGVFFLCRRGGAVYDLDGKCSADVLFMQGAVAVVGICTVIYGACELQVVDQRKRGSCTLQNNWRSSSKHLRASHGCLNVKDDFLLVVLFLVVGANIVLVLLERTLMFWLHARINWDRAMMVIAKKSKS
ncbi:hypothetical protein EDB85DRAFT_1898984 [Lactarius pseudohatsudake]|nr:hypothetical protein EDB85DRAFT_1898984 [Lactarius pseudohatsudake]